jgi:RHS repeat-associated protein
VPYLGGTSCAIEWYENIGVNAGDYEFGSPRTIRLPTWPWRDDDGTPDADEFCSLSGQFSMYAEPGYPTLNYPGAYVLYSFGDMNRDGVVDLSVGLSGVDSALFGFGWPASTDCPTIPAPTSGGGEAADDPGFPDPSKPEIRQPVAQISYCHRWEIYANNMGSSGNRTLDFATAFYAPSPVYAEAHDETLLPNYTVRSSRQAVADMTGDGYPDFVRVDTVPNDPSKSRWIVYPFNGTDLEPGFFWTFDDSTVATGFYPDQSVDIDDPQSPEDYHTGGIAALWDMNADGLPDLYRTSLATGELEILYNRGGAAFTAPISVGVMSGFSDPGAFTNTKIDVTAGTTDAVRTELSYPFEVQRDGRLDLRDEDLMYYNLGDGFLSASDWMTCSTLACFPKPAPYSEVTQSDWRQVLDLIDIDGNGFREEVYEPNLDGPSGVNFVTTTAPPGHLVAVDNGRGLVTDITYAPLGDPDAATFGDGEHPSSRWVVKSLTATHQFGGAPPSTSTYHYDTPVRTADARGLLGFRGFESVIATGPSGARTETRFDYAVDWSGRAVASLVYPDGSADPSSIVDSSWQSESLSLGAATPIELFHASTASYVCEHLDASGATSYHDETSCRAQVNPRVKFAERVPLLEGAEVIARVPGWSFDAEQTGATELEGFYQLAERAHIYTADTYRIVTTRADKRAGTATGGPGAWQVPATRTGLVEHTYDSSLRLIERTCTARDPDEVSGGGVDPGLGACAAFDYNPDFGQLVRTMKPEQYHAEVIVGSAQPFDPGTSYSEIDYTDIGVDPLSIHQVYPVHTRNALGHQVTTRADLGTGVVLETSGPNVDEGGHLVIDGFGRALETWVNSSGTFEEPTDPVVPMRSAVFEYTDTPGPEGRVIAGKFDHTLSDSTSTLGWAELHTYLDGAGRTIKELEWAYDLSGGGLQVVNENRWAYDAAGNLVTATGPDPSQPSHTVTVDYTYQHDSLGRQVCALRPDDSGVATIYGGRASRVLELVPDGAGGGTCSSPTSSSTDAAAAKTTIADVFGRVVEVRERVDSTTEAETNYEYSPRGDLSKITRIGESSTDDVITEMSYDWVGNRLTIDRHERTWSYRFDRNANLLSVTAPIPKNGTPIDYVTSFLYDVLDRQIERLDPVADLSTAELQELAVGTTTTSYDTAQYGIGRPAQVTSPFATITLDYNARGLVSSETRSFDLTAALGLPFSVGDSFTETMYWNAFGQVQATVSNAAGAMILYDWERLPSVLNDVSMWGPELINGVLLERNAAGLVTKAEHSAGLFDSPNRRGVTFTRDQLGRVLSETSNDSAADQIVQTFSYGGSDEVQATTSQIGTLVAPRSFTYSYDDRHQLTAADDDVDYSAAFEYTRTGKLASAFVSAPTGPGTLTYPRDVVYQYASELSSPGPDDPIDPEIPVALVPQGGSLFDTQLDYDVAGNLTSRTVDGQTFGLRYDGANRLRVRNLPGGASELYYYHDGARWLAVTRDGAGAIEKVRFWMGGTEIVYACNAVGCTKAETRTTLSIAGRDWVRVDVDASGNATNNVLHQSGLGHLLGVYSAVYDPGTSTTDYQLQVGFQYGPYGEILETGSAPLANPADFTERFNGKDLDTDSGLSYYGHRYYDPVTLAWNRADPFYRFLPEAAGTDSRLGNLYTFSLNNPVRYVDPDGLSPGMSAGFIDPCQQNPDSEACSGMGDLWGPLWNDDEGSYTDAAKEGQKNVTPADAERDAKNREIAEKVVPQLTKEDVAHVIESSLFLRFVRSIDRAQEGDLLGAIDGMFPEPGDRGGILISSGGKSGGGGGGGGGPGDTVDLVRGVHYSPSIRLAEDHGRVEPRGGSASIYEHTMLGDTKSRWTSWLPATRDGIREAPTSCGILRAEWNRRQGNRPQIARHQAVSYNRARRGVG